MIDITTWMQNFLQSLNKTFGEASEEEKNSVSHRGRAILKLKEVL